MKVYAEDRQAPLFLMLAYVFTPGRHSPSDGGLQPLLKSDPELSEVCF
jgi:hypothetical protein